MLGMMDWQSPYLRLKGRMTQIFALIVAAGRGQRAANIAESSLPKQYRQLGGIAVLTRTVLNFVRHPTIAGVQVVIHPDDLSLYLEAIDGLSKVLPPVMGGLERQASVLAGLEVLSAHQPHHVLIHDAARPFVKPALIDRAILEVKNSGACVPALPLYEALARSDEASADVLGYVDRNAFKSVQTPQCFGFDTILSAHQRAALEASSENFVDDASVALWAGHKVSVFEGDSDNIKLTTSSDFQRGERIISGSSRALSVRVGFGFDIHRTCDGDHVWLCGVRLPSPLGLDGHSDADVALHALTDAILGTLGAGDIGDHFPPTDPHWKGAASAQFVEHALSLLCHRGGKLINIDISLVCEAPKIAPYRDRMRQNLAHLCALPLDAVGLKATTAEKLGALGRSEGIAAYAVVAVEV
jgi:2-C-methyl-D-erythritol 4-phosphate cytidylyltransferase / 2-C-methyl-D-erythritol 2,4-cyclodiphosphate synthase